jgi:glycosyltransferase involved in cell wall biosynthesis
MRSLYVCYFNTEEPLVHTQVLPYLRAVARAGVEMHLLTYEKRSVWRSGERARRRQLKQQLAGDGIHWHALTYHKRPSLVATGGDVLAGILYSLWIIARHRIGIIHARAHVPGVIGLPLKIFLRRKLIFDLRGLMAEEYVDNHVWAAGSLPFRLVKAAEGALLRRADRIIVLTEKLKAILLTNAHPAIEAEKIFVIPCCADLSLYGSPRRLPAGSADRPLTLAYAGSVTGRYMLGEMIEFFKVMQSQRGGWRFLVITQADHAQVRREFASRGVGPDSYRVVAASPRDVPTLLAGADAALSFVKPSLAVSAMSPTKLGEYLAAGLPVVSTPGGDTDALLESETVGAVVHEFHAAAYEMAADQLLALLHSRNVHERCRAAAERYYSLATVGEPRYIAVYRSLGESGVAAADDEAIRAALPGSQS